MLKSFKKKRTNSSVITQQKKVVERKRQAKAKAISEELSDSSDSNSDSNSDSEYEEILISNLKKYPLPKHTSETVKPKEKQEEPSVARELKVDLPPKPTLKKEETANHSNHFQEEETPTTTTTPIDIARSLTGIATPSPIVPSKKKHKSKKIVIKKYYQHKYPKPRSEKEEPKIKTNFLGFPISDVSENSRERNHITSRIFNW